MAEQIQNIKANNKRIAKNTILLYFRTIFIMLITLYTSRVILNQLGVEDYGIYNVVGGVVAMFAVISSALSSAISRFITFELGRGDSSRLRTIFSTSINIQIGISLLVLLLGEIIGVRFLNYKMIIPPERLTAANWVFQCSLITFCVNLISVPYNALIIAYERMSAFAYISILEATLKLAICYLLIVSPWDKLIAYAVLIVTVSIIIRFTYSIYCVRHFQESHYKWGNDRSIVREMTSFAGWNFLTNTTYIFNTQGVSLLVNVFFGVTLNAARGIASQVESAVMQFVNNFTTAINPQITKCYAAGEKDQMFTLVCRGAKFSYLLLLMMALPLIIETPYILKLWLNIVPDMVVIFVRLTLIGSMVNILGNSCYTACMATGDLKRYVIWVTLAGLSAFPLTWVAYACGLSAEYAYIIYILVYIGVNATRLYIMRGLLQFPTMMFVREVLVPISLTTIVGSIIPILASMQFEQSFLRFVITGSLSVVSVGLATCYIGLTRHECEMILGKIIKKITKK